MLTKRGVTSRASNYAAIGSENNDRHFDYIRLLSLSNQRLSRTKQTPFLYIEATVPNGISEKRKTSEAALSDRL